MAGILLWIIELQEVEVVVCIGAVFATYLVNLLDEMSIDLLIHHILHHGQKLQVVVHWEESMSSERVSLTAQKVGARTPGHPNKISPPKFTPLHRSQFRSDHQVRSWLE